MVAHCVGEVGTMTSQGVTASGGGTGSPAASPSPSAIDTGINIVQLESTTAVNVQQPQLRKPNENRRSNKPIMEKRRRARINNCLNELKSLILDAMKKDPARHSKLEKADILEMTVKHLENMQRQQVAMTAATDPQVLNKFRAGFSECAGEVGRFPGLEPPVRRRLLQHLANILNSSFGEEGVKVCGGIPKQTNGQNLSATSQTAGVQVHILPATDARQSGILFSSTSSGGSVQLVPTRLPNGDIALILPSTVNAGQVVPSLPSSQTNVSVSNENSSLSPLPVLIPIPSRTPSTASSAVSDLSSISSSCQTPVNSSINSSTSPISFDRLTVTTTPSPGPQSPISNQQISPNSYHHDNHNHHNLYHQLHHQEPPLKLQNNMSQQSAPVDHIIDRQRVNYNRMDQHKTLTTVTKPVAMIPPVSNQVQSPQNNVYCFMETQTDAKPLSLVINKKHVEQVVSNENPWRPW